MAFATKYRTQFKNWEGKVITIEIQEDPFVFTLEDFTSVGPDPLTITHETDVYLKHAYIIPSVARFSLYVNNEFDLQEMLYSTDRQFKVIISNDDATSNVLFTGFLISGISSEDYTTGRYVINFTATDGLSDLKNIPYLNSGALYDAFQSPLTIIQKCLLSTGNTTTTLWENTDIYAASGMTTTVTTHSPLNQSFIHSSAYGETIENVLSCWDVLEKVMQAFHCRIFQAKNILTGNNSRWIVSKINEIDSTKTYRLYDSIGGLQNNTSYAPLLTMGTDIDHVNGKGQISIRQAFKEITQNSDRVLISKLLAGTNFDADDFDGSGVLTDWTNATTHFPNYTISAFTANSSALGGYIEAQDEGKTVLRIRPHTSARFFIDITSTSGDGATTTVVCAFAHGFTTNNLIHIVRNSVKHDGAYKITVTSSTVFTFSSAESGGALGGQCTHYETIRAMDQRISFHGETAELTNDDQIEIVINARIEATYLPIGLYAELGTGSFDDSFYITDKVSQWNRGDNLVTTNGAFILLDDVDIFEYKDYTLLIDLASMDLTSAELYLVIGSPYGGDAYINSIEVRGISDVQEKTQTSITESNNTEILEYNFHH